MFIFMTSTDHRKTTLNFDYLYKKYKNSAWVYICNHVYDQGLREDTLQEVFTKLYMHLEKESFESEALARSWLKKVTKNTTIDMLAKNKTMTKKITFHAGDDIVLTNYEDPKSPQPLDEVMKKELAEQLQDALDTLKPMHKQVLEMHFYNYLSVKEISQRLGLSVFTVYSRLGKAKKCMDKEIDKLKKRGLV